VLVVSREGSFELYGVGFITYDKDYLRLRRLRDSAARRCFLFIGI
jgi:hypothetical protein